MHLQGIMVVLFHQTSSRLGNIEYKHHDSLQLRLTSRELDIVIVGMVTRRCGGNLKFFVVVIMIDDSENCNKQGSQR